MKTISDRITRILRKYAISGKVEVEQSDVTLITVRFTEHPKSFSVACEITQMLRKYFFIAKLTEATIDATQRTQHFFCKTPKSFTLKITKS